VGFILVIVVVEVVVI